MATEVRITLVIDADDSGSLKEILTVISQQLHGSFANPFLAIGNIHAPVALLQSATPSEADGRCQGKACVGTFRVEIDPSVVDVLADTDIDEAVSRYETQVAAAERAADCGCDDLTCMGGCRNDYPSVAERGVW